MLGKKGAGTGVLIGLLVLVLVAVELIPIIRDKIDNGNLSASDKAIMTIVPIIAVIGILVFAVRKSKIGGV